MKLEEAIKILQKLLEQYNLIDYRFNNMLDFEETDAIETVLNYIENSVPKEKVEEKIKELEKEFNKLDEETDKYLKEDNKNLTKYYEQRERTAVIQTIGWAIGKFEELLEGK